MRAYGQYATDWRLDKQLLLLGKLRTAAIHFGLRFKQNAKLWGSGPSPLVQTRTLSRSRDSCISVIPHVNGIRTCGLGLLLQVSISPGFDSFPMDGKADLKFKRTLADELHTARD